jgi:hypothetical protein
MMIAQYVTYQHRIASKMTRSWHSNQTIAHPPARRPLLDICVSSRLLVYPRASVMELRGDIIKSE